jgi:hypothetical protein
MEGKPLIDHSLGALSQRLNTARRVLAVQRMYLKYKSEGVTKKVVWKRYVFPTFHISERTMDRYLAINARKQIKKLTQVIEEKKAKKQCETN